MLKKNKKKKKIAKIHGILTAFFLFFYILSSLIIDPRFLLSDARDKYQALAESVTVTLRVPDKPGKPLVTSLAGCSSVTPYINLQWNDTSDTETYDIYRNYLPLITGLTDSDYRDITVAENTTYIYQVVANGPAGDTSSDEITVASEKCEIPFTATMEITSFQGRSITGVPKSTDRTPGFSGVTNIPNASVQITVAGHPIFGFTTANINGYWSWETAEKLNYGTYTLWATTTDPLDSDITASDSLAFKIIEKEEEEKEEKPSKKETAKAPAPETPAQKKQEENPDIIIPVSPFNISLKVENTDRTVWAGEKLDTSLIINSLPDNLSKKDAKINYSLLDEAGKIIWEESETFFLSEGKIIRLPIGISPLTPEGSYKVVAKIKDGKNIISAEDYFIVKEIPLISLGTISLTFRDLMSALGWIVWILSLLLLLFLLWLSLEHHLSRRALFHITENYLAKKGYISKRKGVSL